MTDLEISKALALAIGHKNGNVTNDTMGICYVYDFGIRDWCTFDYRDWAVIGPIAKKYDCFPANSKTQGWFANVYGYGGGYADTPQKAIALAVIGAKK